MYVYQGAIGQKITLNIGVSIVGASVRQIKYEKPDGTDGYWTAAQESATEISFTTTVVTDLDKIGNWKLQAYIVMPTWTDHGDIARLTVKKHL